MKEVGGAQHLGLHQRVRRRHEVDPDPDEGRGRPGADHSGAARGRGGREGARARWTSGLSTRGQKPELEVQLNRGLAGSLGITVGQVAQSLRPAFAGIDAGDWVDPSGETRDVTVRLAPAARERVTDLAQLPLVVAMDGSGVPATLPLGQVATHPAGGRSGADRSPGPHQGRDHPGQRRRPAAHAGDPGHPGEAGRHDAPAGLRDHLRRRVAGPGGGVHPDLHRAGRGRAADVPHPRGAVRLVPRSARDPGVAAALADRRRAGALDHAATRSTS